MIQEPHIFSGMQRDVSVSKHPSQYVYDSLNVRFTSRGSDSLLSITNEQGTLDTKVSIDGDYLGHCLLNEYLVVFSKDTSKGSSSSPDLQDEQGKQDNIYRITLVDDPQKELQIDHLFCGDLGFQIDHPIKAISSFETSSIQKIYWTDGVKQPRVINIAGKVLDDKGNALNDSDSWMKARNWDKYSFDFVSVLKLKEIVKVKKAVNNGGMFAPGVIQYAFTYYRKNGQESNIFYTTPLLYISHYNRGASPEEKVDNTFSITVERVDASFDYLRIYSIQRTSINATPIVKRVQDIYIGDLEPSIDVTGATILKAVFTDTGTVGDSIDPTELLYKGGEVISAETLEQKDGTLFLGGLHINRSGLSKDLREEIAASFAIPEKPRIEVTDKPSFIVDGDRKFVPSKVSNTDYAYYNQLNATNEAGDRTVPCGGFKTGDTYRCGVQFQHETGRWSDPVWIKDFEVGNTFAEEDEEHKDKIKVPTIKGYLHDSIATKLWKAGYRKLRPVVVFPEVSDRKVLCQGVVCPAVYTQYNRDNNILHAQSSWFFRPFNPNKFSESSTVTPRSEGILSKYSSKSDPKDIRYTEIEGQFNQDNMFCVAYSEDDSGNYKSSYATFHSPDIDFDEVLGSPLASMDFMGTKYSEVGEAVFTKTLSMIDIQTESPAVSSRSHQDYTHKSFTDDGPSGVGTGLYWIDDFVYEYSNSEGNTVLGEVPNIYGLPRWFVYPWQGNGSLNNDINRPANLGTATAILRKKVISNLRYAKTQIFPFSESYRASGNFTTAPQLFSSNEDTIIRLGTEIYKGNIDTMLNPDIEDGPYLAYEGYNMIPWGTSGYEGQQYVNKYGFVWDGYAETFVINYNDELTLFDSVSYHKLRGNPEGQTSLFRFNNNSTDPDPWESIDYIKIGSSYPELVSRKKAVRMKYKSTPHLVLKDILYPNKEDENYLPIFEISKSGTEGRFGGTSKDALKSNVWIPCGEPVSLDAEVVHYKYNNTDRAPVIPFEYSYGDTYFQRYDCLKTYPFTHEDPNQIVEIGSFMLETRVNIDGRYDRNRGQINNLNISPTIFNLINPVYSQRDNFFSYRILDDSLYELDDFPNQITWSKEKQNGADTDAWTNITLSSTYDMDGSKGKVVSLNTWKDRLFCIQDRGVSQILFNSRVQIPTSDGVPIEISNSYKVDGYRYLLDGIGCSNSQLIKTSPSGVFFIDSISNHLYHVGEELSNITEKHNMSSWFSTYGKGILKLLFDIKNMDVYMVQKDKSLCFSEKLNEFTGSYDYGDLSLIETFGNTVFTMYKGRLFKMFEGEYGDFFGTYEDKVYTPNNKPWSITFISNGADNKMSTQDKTFTNLEFRAIVAGDGVLVDEKYEKFIPTLPIDFIETWDEYQHGYAVIDNSKVRFNEHPLYSGNSYLSRKFRIWRCDIPRNNTYLDKDDRRVDVPYSTDAELGISRYIMKPLDRMRNPWLFIKLKKEAASNDDYLKKTELCDMVVSYLV